MKIARRLVNAFPRNASAASVPMLDCIGELRNADQLKYADCNAIYSGFRLNNPFLGSRFETPARSINELFITSSM